MDRIVEVLRDFRFSDYEIRVLLALVMEGEMTASELAEKSGVPRTSVYEVVRSLESKGFVESFGKPLKFRALSADRLVELFSLRIKEKIEVLSSGLKELEKHSRKEVVEFYRGDIAYQVVDEFVRHSEGVEVYAISLNGEMKRIFEKYGDKVRVFLSGKSEVVHGIAFSGEKVLIFTVRNDDPHIMVGSGEFVEFYRDMVEAFKKKRDGGVEV
ncbi:TrmB family transcriptional regulator [Geoglobus ahangari]